MGGDNVKGFKPAVFNKERVLNNKTTNKPIIELGMQSDANCSSLCKGGENDKEACEQCDCNRACQNEGSRDCAKNKG